MSDMNDMNNTLEAHPKSTGGLVCGIIGCIINTIGLYVPGRRDLVVNPWAGFSWAAANAAKLDDAANFIPARLSALAMIAVCPIVRLDGKHALRIRRRDRRKHASRNSAQTESVAAGALHIALAGPASYFGKVVEKPTLGDGDRPIERADVGRTNALMYGASILLLLLFEAILLPLALFGGLGL